MPPPPNLEWFLTTAFTANQLLRWVEDIAGEPIAAELPGGNTPLADLARAVVKELRRRRIPAATIFTSLELLRPHRADDLAEVRQCWLCQPLPGDAPNRRTPFLITAGVMLVVLALFPTWNWLTAVPVSPPTQSEATSPSVPLATTPDRAPPPISDPPATPPTEPPALRAALQNCYESKCNDAQLAGTPRFCNRTTYTLQLSARQPFHVTFVNLFDGQWTLGDSKLDLQLAPSVPTNAKIHVYIENVHRAVVSESIVALAFRDAATRQAYRRQFGMTRPGPRLPTPAALGMNDTAWEEARFDYEIDPSCH